MAHFAKLDPNNIVTEVIVVNNNTIENKSFPESEPLGITFCQSIFGSNSVWKQTSYNNSFRFRYAGAGYTYDEALDAFIPPKPFPSWTLNNATADWVAPVPMPTDGQMYSWDEATQSWVVSPMSPQ